MNKIDPRTAKWLPGNKGTEFLQFTHARITRWREDGAWQYFASTSEVEPVRLYDGKDFDAAVAAIRQADAQ